MRPELPIALLLVMGALSGCTGDGGESLGGPTSTSPTLEPTPTEEPEPVNEPKYHIHDYWTGRPSVVLFDGPLEIGSTSSLGDQTDVDDANGRVRIGYLEFTPEDDGDNTDKNTPGHVDVVYGGAKAINITMTWDNSDQTKTRIPGLRFSFHHALTTAWFPSIPVESGVEFSLELPMDDPLTDWTDPPHQVVLSKWGFRIEAYDPQGDNSVASVHSAFGEVQVLIKVLNSGLTPIAKPHPDYFGKRISYYAGQMYQNLTSRCVILNATSAASAIDGPEADPITAGSCDYDVLRPPTRVIPWDATQVVADLYYNITSDGSAVVTNRIGLKFHDASNPNYAYPVSDPNDTPGHARYTILVNCAGADSPYVTKTQWEYSYYPYIQGQEDLGGDWTTLNVHIVLHAQRPAATNACADR